MKAVTTGMTAGNIMAAIMMVHMIRNDPSGMMPSQSGMAALTVHAQASPARITRLAPMTSSRPRSFSALRPSAPSRGRRRSTGPLLPYGPGARRRRPLQPIEPVQRGDLVGFGERRIVEDGLDEVVDRPAEGEHRLGDVHQVGGVRADDVRTPQPMRFTLEEQLQHARAVADDLAARDLAEERLSHLVG